MSTSPSRRTLIKAGAWTAPVIVATTAAPAFAASGPLTVTNGMTRTKQVYGNYWGLVFDAFTIESNTALAAGALSVNITVSSSTGPATPYHLSPQITQAADPWITSDPPGSSSPSLTYFYPSAVTANTPVPLEGHLALAMGQGVPVNDATFTVVISAPEATSVVLVFATPSSP